MKNSNLAVIVLTTIVLFSSCRKKEMPELPQNPNQDSEFVQNNADNRFQRDEADQADNDINEALKDIPGFGKTTGVMSISPMCGVTIDSSLIGQKILFFNFDGVTPCFSPSRTRSGQIKVQLTSGQNWNAAGAILTLTYINFQVTRLFDNKWVKFNGVKTLKNINGHDWFAFFSGSFSHVYKERAFNVDVAFNNGATAIWNSARRTTWSYAQSSPVGPNYYFECIGDTAINGISNIDMWGINRFGNDFVTYYDAPWESNFYCGFWRPVSGTIIHQVNNKQFQLDLGVDQSGNPSTLNCAYGYKVTWTVNGNTYSAVNSY
jgi:hypothetical protein